MLTPGESMIASVISRIYLDHGQGEIELSDSVTRLTYVILILDFANQTAVPRKVDVIVDQNMSTIVLADLGAMGPAVPVDADCFNRTEAAFLELEFHLMSLGVSVQIV